jgi:hypothetical protein
MRRILLSCVCAVVLMLPAAASGRVSAQARSKPGFLVVKKAAGDRGSPVVTLVVHGFVLGRISEAREARVDVYHLPSAKGEGLPDAVGAQVSHRPVRWRGLPGTEFNGSGFRFRAIGGFYRVVVRGSGLYLFAGGVGNVRLRGSQTYPHADGTYSVDGAAFRSLPTRLLTRGLGRG